MTTDDDRKHLRSVPANSKKITILIYLSRIHSKALLHMNRSKSGSWMFWFVWFVYFLLVKTNQFNTLILSHYHYQHQHLNASTFLCSINGIWIKKSSDKCMCKCVQARSQTRLEYVNNISSAVYLWLGWFIHNIFIYYMMFSFVVAIQCVSACLWDVCVENRMDDTYVRTAVYLRVNV